jgi:putative membrane protein
MKAYKTAQAVLTGLYVLLWIGGVVSYLFLGGTPADAAWTAPLFLAVAGSLVLLFSPRADAPVLLLCAMMGFAAEALGTATGFPFGRYHYTPVLFPHVLGVPLVMAPAWLVLFAYVRQMVRSPFAAAAWMTAIDLVIDPLAVQTLDYWAWEGTGPYYGIPWTNFAGWFGVSLLLFALARKRAAPNLRIQGLGLSVVLFFTVIALGAGLRLAGGVGIGLVILHAARTIPGARQSAQSTAAAPSASPPR